MAEPVDLEKLEGETVSDQEGRSIGKVNEVCGAEGDGDPMWVTIEARSD